MTHEEMLKLGFELLNVADSPNIKQEFIDEHTLYLFEGFMGGRALIVGSDGEVLYADSSIDFDKHLAAYREGVRTPVEAFDVFK